MTTAIVNQEENITSEQIEAVKTLCRLHSAAWVNRKETREDKLEADRVVNREVWHTIEAVSPILARVVGIGEGDVGKVLGYCCKRVPYQERFDVLQGLCEKALQERPHKRALLTAICRNWLKNWYKAFHYRQHLGLENPVDSESDGNPVTLADTLVNLLETDSIERYENQSAALDMVRRLPPEIREIAALATTKGRRELTPRQKYTLEAFAVQNAITFLADGDGPLTMPTREAVNKLEAAALTARQHKREAREVVKRNGRWFKSTGMSR